MLNDVDIPSQPSPVRIGGFIFDRSTGEIRPDADPGRKTTRLPPQPAKLLQLLIEKHGDLLSRDEIREALWPETHVEFDQSLRFCIRQVRSAFEDSAASPTYVETLPKRGYRLMQTPEPLADDPIEQPPPRSPQEVVPADEVGPEKPARTGPSDGRQPQPHSRRRLILAAAVGAALVAAWLGSDLFRSDAPTGPVRLAIMPFELSGEGEAAAELARLSERLLAELSTRGGDRLEVVGPRSTARYSAFPFPKMDRLTEELEVDYVLNARYLPKDGQNELIVELIRLKDRAHPWVQLFNEPVVWPQVGLEVEDGVAKALELPR